MKRILPLFLTLLAVQLTMAQNATNDDNFVITGTGFNNIVRDMAVQSDGKIIVGGDFTTYNGITRNYIARLNSDGTLDNTFDPGVAMGALVTAVAIDASGNIVAGGSAALKRLTSTGAVDGTFAMTGTGLNGVINTIAIQADGAIVVGGQFSTYNTTTSRNRIARLLSTGAIDPSFDPGTGLNGFAAKLAIQADGKIVVVGSSSGFNTYNGTTRDNIVRILTTGAIDATFVPPSNLKAKMYDIKFQSDNKILVTGEYNGDVTSVFNGIARLNTDGTMDNTFTPTFFQGGRAILIQADGKIIVGGYQPTLSKGIRRLNTNGTTDPFFADEGFMTSSAEVRTLILQSGKILAGGDFSSFNGVPRVNMARITTCTSVAITTQPTFQARCETNDVSFTVTATGSGTITYKWQVKASLGTTYTDVANGGGVTGATAATLAIAGVGVGLNGNTYRCLVTDAVCTATSSGAGLSVLAMPAVSVHPVPSTKCETLSTTFSVTVTNPGLYRWQEDAGSGFVDLVDAGKYSGSGTATLTISNLTTTMTGYKYRCRAGGCTPAVISNDALLTVSAAPIVTVPPAANVFACTGTNAQFSVTATGGTGYQWQEKIGAGSFGDITDGGIYSGATTSTLTLTGVTGTQNAYQYRCIVTGSCNATSGTGSLSVYATPSFTTHPANATKCVGGTATYTVALSSTPAGITYQWQEKVGSGSFANITNGGIYSGATAATLAITGVTAAMDANKYRCIAGTCNPIAASFDADLTVYDPLTITTQPASVLACQGTDATFNAVAAGDGTILYQWQEQSVGGNFVNVANGGIYSGATSQTLTMTGVVAGHNGFRYRCSITNSVCSNIFTNNATLTVPSTVSIATQPAVARTLCGTGGTTFSVSITPATTYQWQVNTGTGYTDITDGGIYSGANGSTLTITGAAPAQNGFKYRCKLGPCPANQVLSNEGTLTVNTPPEITVQPVAKTVCSGTTTSFEITATGTSLVYKWRVNGSNISNGNTYSGANTAILTITSTPTSINNTTYTCEVSGASLCSAVESTPVKLTVNEIAITTQPVFVPTFCEGGNANYSVVASGEQLTYQWQSKIGSADFANLSNAGVYSGVTTASLAVTVVPFSMNGTIFRCVVSGLCTAVNSNTPQMNLFQKPGKPVIIVELNNPETPILNATGVSASAWKWFKNGTQFSTQQTLSNPGEGSYTVMVSNNGCESPMSDAKVIILTESAFVKESVVSLYPNPVATTLTVSLSGFKSGEEVDIMLVDMLGRSMERTSGTGGGEKEINVSSFQAGRYIVRLQQGQQRLVSHFIKTNQ